MEFFSASSVLGLWEDLRKDLLPGALFSPNMKAEEPLACKTHGLRCERVPAQPFRVVVTTLRLLCNHQALIRTGGFSKDRLNFLPVQQVEAWH